MITFIDLPDIDDDKGFTKFEHLIDPIDGLGLFKFESVWLVIAWYGTLALIFRLWHIIGLLVVIWI